MSVNNFPGARAEGKPATSSSFDGPPLHPSATSSDNFYVPLETYKIITGKEKVRVEDFFNFHQSSYDLRGHCYKLATQRSRLEVRRNYFSQSVVGPWNRLPSHVVEAPTVNTFNNRFDRLKNGTP